MRLAAFGFRSIPPQNGSAGAEKFATELYPRLVEMGFNVTAYNRVYGNKEFNKTLEYSGVKIINIKTVNKSGFDSLIHSFKVTIDIIIKNSTDIVHIHNGGNSIFSIILRLFGKKVFISQDGVDWKREKWSWYAKLYLYISSFITAFFPNGVIFDNVFSKEFFEKRYKKKYDFVPYGSEITIQENDESILQKIGLTKGDYFLFVGRFIPDKGLQYLIPAFEKLKTDKKLVLVGGSPNPSEFEIGIKKTSDSRIIFPGFIYGNDTAILMKNCYAYIQPSDLEGLSPVILTVMGLGVPLICSNIEENLFIVKDDALTFIKSSVEDLKNKLQYSLDNFNLVYQLAQKGKIRINRDYSWDSIAKQHKEIFLRK